MGAPGQLPILVVGAGLAGLEAARDMAAMGREVRLVAAGRRLGGALAHIAHLFPADSDPRPGLAALCRDVAAAPRLTISLSTRLVGLDGEPGDLTARLETLCDGQTDPQLETLAVAGVLLATGRRPFEANRLELLGHARIPDVVTSLELAAALTGPGPLVRPSDGKPVRRIAWVLCVGSRLRGPVDNGFCSGVCCSATLGQALALPQVERTLYAMDVRAHLPGSQALLDRALTEGVAVRYARPHTLYPGPGGHGVCFRVSDTGAVRQETVDMVVLVVGTEVADLALEPARVAAVAMSRFRSVRTGCFEPSRTSRPGVLVAGGLAGPAEAATAVIQGAAAAWEVCHLGGLGTSTALAAQARVLVVGGGPAGLSASLALAALGFHVTLAEAAGHLGGNSRKHPRLWKGEPVRPAVEALMTSVTDHPNIAVCLETRVAAVAGRGGEFSIDLETPAGSAATVACAAVVLAMGGQEARPDQYLLDHDPRVVTQLEFEAWQRERPAEAQALDSVVFIQCAGSRGPHWPACGRICCAQALSSAIELKKNRRDRRVVVCYRDITTPGEQEALYTEARRLGVVFVRFSPQQPPMVERLGERLVVTVEDRLLDRSLRLHPDRLVLAAPLMPTGVAATAALFGCATDDLGFLTPADPVFAPVDTTRKGVFAAGLCLGPKPLDATVAEARAAAMRVGLALAGVVAP
ncbi:MAG: FAD-dependent oxidoreductase [Desulfovibrionaceae bacterium]